MKRQQPTAHQRAFGGGLDMRAAQTPGPPVFRVPPWSAAWKRAQENPPEMAEYRCPMAGSVAMERPKREGT